MIRKILTIVIALIIIFVIWFIVYSRPQTIKEDESGASQVEDLETDEVSDLLNSLKQETAIEAELQEVEFDWQVEKNQQIQKAKIIGKGFEAMVIPSQKFNNVTRFFQNNGFKADVFNASSGTVGWSAGYRKNYLVCVVAGGVTGYREATGQWVPPEIDKRDMEVKCGKGDSSIDSVVSKERAIRELFAKKYETKVSAISLNISQETEDHVRGTGQTLDEFVQGGAGEKGVFLAAKVNDNWELAFDGDGEIVCQKLEKYNFPAEMIEDCI